MLWPSETVLMIRHNIFFDGEKWKIIPKIIPVTPSYLEHWFTSLEMILAVGTSQTSDREIKSPNDDILSAPDKIQSNLNISKPKFIINYWVWLFKTNKIVNKRFVKISNANIWNVPIFFVEKNVWSFCSVKASLIFSTKISVYLVINS